MNFREYWKQRRLREKRQAERVRREEAAIKEAGGDPSSISAREACQILKAVGK